LYDLPSTLATSVKISSIIKDKTGYELSEPVQFKDCKPNPLTGVPSPFKLGIIKVDPAQWSTISKEIKYFNIEDGEDMQGNKRVWECRALPFDRDLLGANKLNTNSQLNVFVRGIKDETAQQLENEFSTKFGEVKSAKVSRSAQVTIEKTDEGKKIKHVDLAQPPKSNGYGFVCFQKQEDAEKAI